MAFYPPRGSVSVELFESDDGFSVSDGQVVQGGGLTLIGNYSLGRPNLKWAPAVWTQKSEFIQHPADDSILTDWNHDILGTSETELHWTGEYLQEEIILGWERESGVDSGEPSPVTGTNKHHHRRKMKSRGRSRRQVVEAPPGAVYEILRPIVEYRSIPKMVGRSVLRSIHDNFYQGPSDHFGTLVSNPDGYTIELCLRVISGEGLVLLDDGVIRETLTLKPDGIYLGADLLLAVDWEDSFRTVRLAVKGNDLYLLCEDGAGYFGDGILGGSPSADELRIGVVTDNSGEVVISHIYQAHPGVFIDASPSVDVSYDTSEYETTVPDFTPNREVNGFVSAVVRVNGDVGVGTVTVQVQYRNSGTGVWTNYSTPVTITQNNQVIDLSSVPVLGDLSDQIRFIVAQQADSPTQPPPAVIGISLITDFADSEALPDPDTSVVYSRVVRAWDGTTLMEIRSPFRIKEMVPPDELGVTHLSSPGLDSENGIYITDLSYLESANNVGHPEGAFLDEPDTSTTTSFTYSGLSTDEVLIAPVCSSWGERGEPLFYGYPLGGYRYYLLAPVAGSSNLEIRDSISVHFEDGTPVDQAEYPWDVMVNTSDDRSDPLPPGVFAVILATNRRFIPSRTVLVTYPAVDRSRGWISVDSRTEVVNPEPLVSPDGVFEIDPSLDPSDNTYNLEIQL